MRIRQVAAALSVLAALSVFALVALVGGAPLDADSGTPGSATTTATPDPTASPPGVDETGIVNASRLVAAHRSSLVSSGFVSVSEHTVRSSGPRENVTLRREVAATRNLDAVSIRRARRGELTGRSVTELWADGSTELTRYDRADRGPTVESAADVRDRAGEADLARLTALLERAEFDLVSVTRDGNQRYFTFRADSYDRSRWPRGEPDEVGVSMRLVVTAEGRIRSVRATVNRIRTVDGQRRWVLEAFTYRVVRTDLDRLDPPEWARTAGGREGEGR